MSADAPTVSVITATYNRRAMLRYALQSLLAQDFSDFEAWIIGDGCTDGSEEEVARLGDARLHWLNLPVNGGNQWRPNNEGLQHARGRYIAFLGHDDLWLPWHLSRLVAHAEKSGLLARAAHGACRQLFDETAADPALAIAHAAASHALDKVHIAAPSRGRGAHGACRHLLATTHDSLVGDRIEKSGLDGKEMSDEVTEAAMPCPAIARV